MGCRSSCAIFEHFSTAVEWIAKEKLEIEGVTHILDDFLLIAKTHKKGGRDLKNFQIMSKNIGMPLAPEKTEGPNTCITFAGIELDSVAMVARLPDDKKAKCLTTIQTMLAKKKATLKEIQSVVGLLGFATKVVVPGRAFLRRLINLTRGVTKPYYHIRLTKQAKADLAAWAFFLEQFNGRAFFLPEQWLSTKALHVYTDASGTLGYGAVFGSQWFFGSWPEHWFKENITLKELFPIVAAVMLWAPQLANKRIMMHTDNLALVHIINSNTSKDGKIMTLLRKCVITCMMHNILFKAEHIPGYQNVLADSLSRLQVQAFRERAPWAEASPKILPTDILPQHWFLAS